MDNQYNGIMMEYENDSAITISGDDEMATDMRKIIWIPFSSKLHSGI